MHVVAVASALAIAAATVFGCAAGQDCPAALLTGVLVEQNGQLVVAPDSGAPLELVSWPADYNVRLDDGALVLVQFGLFVKAREGDTVFIGGGETINGTWGPCGRFDVDPV